MASTDYSQYGILAGNQVIGNSGTSTILGDLGSFLPVGGVGTINVSGVSSFGTDIDPAIQNAQNDYASLFTIFPGNSVSAADIGGMTFNPGVTEFTNAGGITIGTVASNNTITLDGNGSYIFQIPNGGLTTDTTLDPVFINLVNGAKPTQIFWLVNGSVDFQTQGSNVTNFLGTFISQGNISLGTGSNHIGSLVASNFGDITLNGNKVTATAVQQPRDVTSPNYINIESTLADNQSVTISASNVFGGIDINAGLGGITIDTTNSLLINAGAASNFTTSVGNLTLEAITGLLNMDGGSGINLGNASTSTPINIGTSANLKLISMGNLTGATEVNLNAGTGGVNVNTAAGGSISLNANGAVSNFTVASTADNQDLTLAITGTTNSSIVLSSTGTGADSIFFNTSAGGLIASIADAIQLVSFDTTGAAISLDSSANNGGITLLSGNQGIVLNAVNGTIGLGNFAAATILLGTVGSNTITIGNNAVNTRIFERFGTAGFVYHQEAETALADSDATLTIAELLTVLFTIAPSVPRTLTLPTAADAVAGITGVAVNDSIDFSIINTGASTATIAAGAGGSITGNATVASLESGYYRLRFTNVTAASEAYVVYKLS